MAAEEWAQTVRLKKDGIPIVVHVVVADGPGGLGHGVTRERRPGERVLYDLERRQRPAGATYHRLIQQSRYISRQSRRL